MSKEELDLVAGVPGLGLSRESEGKDVSLYLASGSVMVEEGEVTVDGDEDAIASVAAALDDVVVVDVVDVVRGSVVVVLGDGNDGSDESRLLPVL